MTTQEILTYIKNEDINQLSFIVRIIRHFLKHFFLQYCISSSLLKRFFIVSAFLRIIVKEYELIILLTICCLKTSSYELIKLNKSVLNFQILCFRL